MKYRVRMSPAVLEALQRQVAFLREQGAALTRVDAWLDDLLAAVDTLEQMPWRYPVAEAMSQAFGGQVHRLLRGDYVLLFRVDDATATVELLAFRHGRQAPPGDIRES